MYSEKAAKLCRRNKWMVPKTNRNKPIPTKKYTNSCTKATLHFPCIDIALKRLENSVGLSFKVHVF